MEKLYYQPDLLNMERLVSTVQKLSLARDIDTVMQIVRTVARELTGADGATFVLRDEDKCFYAEEDAIAPLWKGSRFPMKSCASGWVMNNKKPIVIEDIYNDDRIPVDAYRPTFVKSMAMVPIRTLDPIGAIGNYWAKLHLPTEEEIALLQSLADITAVSIENIEVRSKLEVKLSERTQMLHQITEQKKQLEEFCQIIAHNLRAPLSNLVLLNDMMKETHTIEEKLQFIEKQEPVVHLLHEVFEEVVEAIQVTMEFSVEKEYNNLEACTKKIWEQLREEVAESNARITFDFSEVYTVHFPHSYLENILFNLLSNAIRYRAPGRSPEIKIRSFREGGWVGIEVADNGLGLDLTKYGDKIFKLRKTFHRHPKAKGFGLFITKTQLEAMGGAISVESIPDNGSKFKVLFHESE
jgi:signal transduction histidine kinase